MGGLVGTLESGLSQQTLRAECRGRSSHRSPNTVEPIESLHQDDLNHSFSVLRPFFVQPPRDRVHHSGSSLQGQSAKSTQATIGPSGTRLIDSTPPARSGRCRGRGRRLVDRLGADAQKPSSAAPATVSGQPGLQGRQGSCDVAAHQPADGRGDTEHDVVDLFHCQSIPFHSIPFHSIPSKAWSVAQVTRHPHPLTRGDPHDHQREGWRMRLSSRGASC